MGVIRGIRFKTKAALHAPPVGRGFYGVGSAASSAKAMEIVDLSMWYHVTTWWCAGKRKGGAEAPPWYSDRPLRDD